jgi:cysteine-rich repeat protein
MERAGFSHIGETTRGAEGRSRLAILETEGSHGPPVPPALDPIAPAGQDGMAGLARSLPRSDPPPEGADLEPRGDLRRIAFPLALALATGIAGAASPPAESPRLEPRLARAIQGPLPPQGIAIGVALRDDDLPRPGPARSRAIAARQGRALDALPRGTFLLRHRYASLSGFAGWAQPAAIEALLAWPEVELVYLDGTVHATLAQGAALIGATAAHTLGITGAGMRVAVLDTGIDADHPHLADDLAAQQCFCDDHPSPTRGCCPNGRARSTSAEDDAGHGTNVAGIITSSRPAGPGVAPDAEIVAVKVLASNGSGAFSDVAAGLDWVLTNRAALGVRVVNLSLGDGVEHSDPNASPCSGTNTANGIEALHAVGVAVFAASGNSGFDDGIEFPACVAEAISVGGVYDAAVGPVSWCGNATCSMILCTDATTAADRFVCHSNSDELLDILAPDWRTDTTALGGGTASFGGTSAASPYAAAEAALLLEADASLAPAQIRTLLATHGPAVQNPDNGLSFTRSDVGAAIASIAPGTCGNGAVENGEQCDDGNAADGDCCSAACSLEAPGSPCQDGDACTQGDACDGGGSCVAGAPLSCDDGAFCNGLETCDPGSGCLPGTPPANDDGVACTVDGCDEDADAVRNVASDALCDDGAFCNGAETCDALSGCLPGTPPAIDDGVACTVDGCDEDADAVRNAPDDALCDDADPCTAERCDAELGCTSEPVAGCATPVPSGSRGSRLALGLLLAAVGTALARRRRGSGAPVGSPSRARARDVEPSG